MRALPARRAFNFFYARPGGGSTPFLCRVGRGAIPRPVGFARPSSSREKRSPPRDPRGLERVKIPLNANQGRCRAGRVRLCPLPTSSGRLRCTGRVTASCDADEKRGRFSPRARHPDRQRATDRVPKRGQLREARTRQNCLALARRLAPPTGSARGASATLANARRISPRASATVRVAAAWSSTKLVNRDYQRSTVASAAVFLFLFGLRGSDPIGGVGLVG